MDTTLAPIFIYLQKNEKKIHVFLFLHSKAQGRKRKNVTCFFSLYVTENTFSYSGKNLFFLQIQSWFLHINSKYASVSFVGKYIESTLLFSQRGRRDVMRTRSKD